jgi:hypothetical protein
MPDIRLPAMLACFAGACGLANATVAEAEQYTYLSGAACQLSIPTTDTKFRPKATGARNESTAASNFVICALPTGTATSNDYFTEIWLPVYSLDGTPRNVSCTAVTGAHTLPGNGFEATYSAKSATVSDTGNGFVFEWNAGDFGGTSGQPIPKSLGFSVTCNLPPETAINYILGFHG